MGCNGAGELDGSEVENRSRPPAEPCRYRYNVFDLLRLAWHRM